MTGVRIKNDQLLINHGNVTASEMILLLAMKIPFPVRTGKSVMKN